MDLLEQLAVHQSESQIAVLHFVVSFASIIFLPFVSYLFGGLILSLYYGRKGRMNNDPDALLFSRDVLDHLIPTKSILFLFGIVPFLTILFAYAQLLQETSSISVSILTWGILWFALAAAFSASYNSAMKLHSTLTHVHEGSEDISQIRTESRETQRTSGKYALVFLSISILLFFCGTSLGAKPGEWNDVQNIFQLVFSWDVFFKMSEFILIALAIASLGTVYFTFKWQGGKKNITVEYASFLKSHALTIAIICILILPAFLVLSVYTTSEHGLTGGFYGAVFLALLFLFLAIHFVYGMMIEFKSSYAGNAFFVFFLAIFFISFQDNTAFSSATKDHSSLLAYQFEQYHEDLLSSMGVSLNVLTGQDIFDAKCSACHRFDQKKVGPAYKDVLPKYEGHRDQLIAFISNPVKKNPAFPNMPNQGLKPSEVDSIAAFIMKTYKKFE